MSKVVRRHWTGDGSGPTRKDRLGCDYQAYVPDELQGRSFVLGGEVAADIAEAEAAILKLNANATSLTNTEALARILLRAEAVASSRIEGLEVGARRLLHAEVSRETEGKSTDVTASEVLSNIDAMAFAVASVKAGDVITLDTVLGVHERLLSTTRLSHHGGRIREEQNWIGGSDYNPCSAAFVPPPHDLAPGLMADLVAFCNEEGLPPVAQAGIAHAQFETIHPFVDGNGRTGRALMHIILRRRGLAENVLTPVSLILATWAKAYVNALTGYRYVGAVDSVAAREGINAWVSQFATACTRACSDAESFELRVRAMQTEWRDRVGKVRRNSAADLLLQALPGAPVLTASGAAGIIKRTFPAANNAITLLTEAGVLKQVTVGKRNRAYEAPDIIAAFSDLERQLASPEGDTRSSQPTRRVPPRSKGVAKK
jgi:Fic family protein